MASQAPPAPAPAPARRSLDGLTVSLAPVVRHGLWIGIGVTALVRIAAIMLQAQPLWSDGLSYFTLAKTLAETGVMIDNFGHHAFFSPGYPLLLAPFFWAFGAGSPVAHAVNVALACTAAALVWRLVQALGGGRGAALIGALAFAVWVPSIHHATDLARENLSTPLMLGFALLCVAIARGRTDWPTVAGTGLVYGLNVLSGTSTILTGAAFAVALAIALHRRPRAILQRLALFAGAALLVVGPWVYSAERMTRRPLITSNGPFNLYLGNNPAATGRFVSIRDTPVGGIWHRRIAVLGETGMSDWLADETKTWVAANPGRAAALAAKKLALFWAPPLPSADALATSRALVALRIVDLLQYLAILALAGVALFARLFDRRLRWTLAALVIGFWAIHGATYIIMRYRDPVLAVLIALAALTAARLLEEWRARRTAPA